MLLLTLAYYCLFYIAADGELIWEEIDQQGETPTAREGHTFRYECLAVVVVDQ